MKQHLTRLLGVAFCHWVLSLLVFSLVIVDVQAPGPDNPFEVWCWNAAHYVYGRNSLLGLLPENLTNGHAPDKQHPLLLLLNSLVAGTLLYGPVLVTLRGLQSLGVRPSATRMGDVRLTSAQKTGRLLLLGVIAVVLLVEVGVSAMQWFRGTAAGEDAVRFCLTAGLMYFLWSGRRWARWLTVVLSSAGALFGLAAGIWNAWGEFTIPGIAYAVVACCLLCFPQVGEFLQAQRARAS